MAAPLVSLAAVKTELGITGNDPAVEARLERLIAVASSQVESFCGRTFARAGVVENVACSGGMDLLVSRRPLLAVTSIVGPDDAELDATAYTIHDSAAGIIRGASGPFSDTALERADFSEGTRAAGTERKTYVVTYDGGWVTGAQVAAGEYDTQTLPLDLEDAVMRLVNARWWSRGSARDPTIASESLGKFSVTYRGGGDVVAAGEFGGGLPADVVGLLKPYAQIIHG